MTPELAASYDCQIIHVDNKQKLVYKGVLVDDEPMNVIAMVIWDRELACEYRGKLLDKRVCFASCSNKFTSVFECLVKEECAVQATDDDRITFCQHCLDRVPPS